MVRSAPQQVRIEGDRLIADAGLPMAKAATIAKEAGLTGLEFGLAIPGTVGGAVWANAGAHGSDIAGVLLRARASSATTAPRGRSTPTTSASPTARASSSTPRRDGRTW